MTCVRWDFQRDLNHRGGTQAGEHPAGFLWSQRPIPLQKGNVLLQSVPFLSLLGLHLLNAFQGFGWCSREDVSGKGLVVSLKASHFNMSSDGSAVVWIETTGYRLGRCGIPRLPTRISRVLRLSFRRYFYVSSAFLSSLVVNTYSELCGLIQRS